MDCSSFKPDVHSEETEKCSMPADQGPTLRITEGSQQQGNGQGNSSGCVVGGHSTGCSTALDSQSSIAESCVDCSSNEVYIKTELKDIYLPEDGYQDEVYSKEPTQYIGTSESTDQYLTTGLLARALLEGNKKHTSSRRFVDIRTTPCFSSFSARSLNTGNSLCDEQPDTSKSTAESNTFCVSYADSASLYFLLGSSRCAQKARSSNVFKKQRRKRSLGPKIFYCYHCQYQTNKKNTLQYHIMSVHTKLKPFSCQLCDFKAVHRGHLNKHVTSKHTKEFPYTCPYCEYNSANRSHLKNHVLARHTAERPYACPHCAYSTVDKGSLKNHIMYKHTMQKPFSCPHCVYSSVRRSDLKLHILGKHSVSKPLSCTQCSYTAKNNANLKMHIAYKHTEKPLLCMHCNHRFVRTRDLVRHINFKHK